MAAGNGALRVVVAGGGIAGLEAIAALRALAGARVAIRLVAPEREFVYRPLSVAEPFTGSPPPRRALAEIAADFDVRLTHDALERVMPSAQRVFTRGGDELEYDELVVTVGAHRHPYWNEALTFRGPEDVDALRALAAEVAGGAAGSVAIAVPPGSTWALPAYELALLLVTHAGAAGRRLETLVATPERRPLEVFGETASAAVGELLADAGIELRTDVEVDVASARELIVGGERFEVDRIVALPFLDGPAVPGLPADARGFVPIDSHGRVVGADHVFAAGDGAAFALKQGGLATQQADAIAEVIAKRAGAPVDPRPFRPVLRGLLLTGTRSRYLRTELGARAAPGEVSERPLWWPAEKVAGQYLSGYVGHTGPGAPPDPADVEVDVQLAVRDEEPPPAHGFADD